MPNSIVHEIGLPPVRGRSNTTWTPLKLSVISCFVRVALNFFDSFAQLTGLVLRMSKHAKVSKETKVVWYLSIVIARNLLHFESSPVDKEIRSNDYVSTRNRIARVKSAKDTTYKWAAENGARVNMIHVVGMNNKYVFRLTNPSR